MKKIENHIYVAFFIIFIFSPILLINRDNNAVSILENKKLANRPMLILEGKINENFIGEFENYIDDNIGFKQEAVEGDILIMKKLFNVLDIKDYFIGEDNNIFYTNNGYGYGVYQGNVHYNDYEKELFYENLSKVTIKLKDMGATCIYMGIPDKENIYPEYYSRQVNRYSSDTPLDDLLKYLDGKGDVNVLNPKNDLLAAKELTGEYLYYRNYDCTHWNAKGMFVGYNTLMDKINEFDKDIKRVSVDEIKWSKELSRNMSYLRSSELLNKYIIFYDDIWDYTLKGGQHSINTNSVPDTFELSTNNIYFHYENHDTENGKTLIIVGDSYIYQYMLRLLGESFQDVYFLQDYTAEQLVSLVEITGAEFVVIENVERAFYYWPLIGCFEDIYM